MKKVQVISVKFDDAIEMVENLEYLLHKDTLPEDKQERLLRVVNSLQARIQLQQELKKFQEWEDEN